MTDYISECFKTFIVTNWCEDNFSSPDNIEVMSEKERPTKYKKTKVEALLIDQGDLEWIPVDEGGTSGSQKYRVWRTNIYFNHSSSANIQGVVDEFVRLVHSWEANGGGTFSSDDGENLKTIDFMTFSPVNKYCANMNLTLRGFYEQVSVV